MKPSLGSWRRVYLRMWGDARFRALSPLPPSGQALFIHFIAGPRTTCIPGIILGGESALAESCRWPLKAFREAYREVLREGLAEGSWGDGLVWVPKAIKYNPPQSPNVIKSWTRTWNDDVPECALKMRIFQDLKAFTEGLPKAFTEAFREGIAIPSGIQIADRIPPPSESGSSLSSPTPNPVPIPTGSTKLDGNGDVLALLPAAARLTPEGLMAMWNDLAPACRRAEELNGTRRKIVAQRLRERPEGSAWAAIIRRINASAFCTGENDRGWKADFEFLVRPDTGTRVLEGRFDDGAGPALSQSSRRMMRAGEKFLARVQGQGGTS